MLVLLEVPVEFGFSCIRTSVAPACFIENVEPFIVWPVHFSVCGSRGQVSDTFVTASATAATRRLNLTLLHGRSMDGSGRQILLTGTCTCVAGRF